MEVVIMAMMKKENIVQNYIYNFFYQILSLLTPLITAPYVSRVLGSNGVGQYSFVSSIVSYFILFANLGFTYHGLREIAALQGNRDEQSRMFWGIFFARLICVLSSMLIYITTVCMGVYGRYTLLMVIVGIQLLAAAFDISFLFQANDIFDIIAIRNMAIKVIAILSIFAFVKKEDDLWKYVLIQCLIHLISNLTLWPKMNVLVNKPVIHELGIAKHFKSSFVLFVPQIAISVYNILDRTLIGVLVKGQQTTYVNGVEVVKMVSDIENGYYEQSQKIVTMAMTVFTALSTVLISRNSNEIAVGNMKQLKKNLNGTIDYLFFIGAPISFGLAAVAHNFSPWFFGPGYEKTPGLIMIFSPFVIIVGLSNILGRQYMNPAKRDREFTLAIFAGAGSNLLLNILLIPKYKSYGAAAASLIAETIVTIIMALMVREDINIVQRFIRAWRIWLSSFLMMGIVYFLQTKMVSSVVNTLLLIALGIVIYFITLITFREPYLIIAKDVITKKLLKMRK